MVAGLIDRIVADNIGWGMIKPFQEDVIRYILENSGTAGLTAYVTSKVVRSFTAIAWSIRNMKRESGPDWVSETRLTSVRQIVKALMAGEIGELNSKRYASTLIPSALIHYVDTRVVLAQLSTPMSDARGEVPPITSRELKAFVKAKM